MVCERGLGQLAVWAWRDGNGGPKHQNQEPVGGWGEGGRGADELNSGHV